MFCMNFVNSGIIELSITNNDGEKFFIVFEKNSVKFTNKSGSYVNNYDFMMKKLKDFGVSEKSFRDKVSQFEKLGQFEQRLFSLAILGWSWDVEDCDKASKYFQKYYELGGRHGEVPEWFIAKYFREKNISKILEYALQADIAKVCDKDGPPTLYVRLLRLTEQGAKLPPSGALFRDDIPGKESLAFFSYVTYLRQTEKFSPEEIIAGDTKMAKYVKGASKLPPGSVCAKDVVFYWRVWNLKSTKERTDYNSRHESYFQKMLKNSKPQDLDKAVLAEEHSSSPRVLKVRFQEEVGA